MYDFIQAKFYYWCKLPGVAFPHNIDIAIKTAIQAIMINYRNLHSQQSQQIYGFGDKT